MGIISVPCRACLPPWLSLWNSHNGRLITQQANVWRTCGVLSREQRNSEGAKLR